MTLYEKIEKLSPEQLKDIFENGTYGDFEDLLDEIEKADPEDKTNYLLHLWLALLSAMPGSTHEEQQNNLKLYLDKFVQFIARGKSSLKNDGSFMNITTSLPQIFVTTEHKLKKELLNKDHFKLATENDFTFKVAEKGNEIITNTLKIVPATNVLECLSHFDIAVGNAVNSFYKNGTNHITTAMIYRYITQCGTGGLPQKNFSEAIQNSMNTYLNTRIWIDRTDEARAFIDEKIQGYDEGVSLISWTPVKVKIRGKTTFAYRIDNAPILLTYKPTQNKEYDVKSLNIQSVELHRDKKTNVITSYEIKAKSRMSPQRVAIRSYLLSRIEEIKRTWNEPKYSRNISMSEIYKAALIDEKTADTQTKHRIRLFTEECLTYWITEEAGSIIKDFDTIFKGKSIVSYSIYL